MTLGVLIALRIQQWNEDRLDRVEEKAVLDRLLSDLRTDAELFAFLTSTATGKLENLARLKAIFDSGKQPAEPERFLQDIVGGAELGWSLRGAQRSAFDEILSSGKLGLIRDATLRNGLLDYYGESDAIIDRTDARESDFPELSYQLIPRQTSARGNILELSADLTARDIERIVDDVLASPLRDQVTGETNVGRFILMWATNFESGRHALESAIRDYRDSLEYKINQKRGQSRALTPNLQILGFHQFLPVDGSMPASADFVHAAKPKNMRSRNASAHCAARQQPTAMFSSAS